MVNPNKGQTNRIVILLTDDELEQVRTYAFENKKKMSDIGRTAIMDYIHGKIIEQKELEQKAFDEFMKFRQSMNLDDNITFIEDPPTTYNFDLNTNTATPVQVAIEHDPTPEPKIKTPESYQIKYKVINQGHGRKWATVEHFVLELEPSRFKTVEKLVLDYANPGEYGTDIESLRYRLSRDQINFTMDELITVIVKSDKMTFEFSNDDSRYYPKR